MKDKIIPMFVFGTLMNEETLKRLGVEPIQTIEASLAGYRKEGLNIISDIDTSVQGLYFQITPMEFAKLDFYEGYPSFYGRFLVNVETPKGWKRAYVYKINGTK